VKLFSSLLESLQESGKHVVNILEVGAGIIVSFLGLGCLNAPIGTGLLTNYLIEELKRNPDLLAEYTVTDASYVKYFPPSF
jgi:hypothetical protein